MSDRLIYLSGCTEEERLNEETQEEYEALLRERVELTGGSGKMDEEQKASRITGRQGNKGISPAPWVPQDVIRVTNGNLSDNTMAIMDQDDCIVALALPALFHTDTVKDESRQAANAQLIASAPDLQAALKDCLGMVEAWACHLQDIGKTDAAKTVNAVLDTARRAYEQSRTVTVTRYPEDDAQDALAPVL